MSAQVDLGFRAWVSWLLVAARRTPVVAAEIVLGNRREVFAMTGKWLAKRVAVFLVGTSLLGLGSCLNLNLDRILRFGTLFSAAEFLLDNDQVFDLFPDGASGGT